ncbi:hypothetical protein BC938DRAFT_478728 [Jimgerdemannia flammicorona]|uniref:Uncharacterized protein n=1 Tax=Jimgerdemannia flammicorona TaxID=994334 RepID=A0A433QMD5_9FUNG|nr:hypothetical protein BC938DRAFT_478728 [Jimgerdemannia flammicorona]
MADDFAQAGDDPCESLNELSFSELFSASASPREQCADILELPGARPSFRLRRRGPAGGFQKPRAAGLAELWCFRFPTSPALTGKQLLPAYRGSENDPRKERLENFLVQQQDWWLRQRELKRRFVQSQFRIPAAGDFNVWCVPNILGVDIVGTNAATGDEHHATT